MKRILLLGLLVVLGGCTTKITRVTGPADLETFQARRAELEALSAFAMQGRVAVRTADDGWSGGLNWKQQGNHVDFSFRGPLGAGAIQVSGDADHLWVRTSRGEDFVTSEAELDFSDELGGTLPVRSMRYWMLGIPHPQSKVANLEVSQGGLLWAMVQDGWRVEVSNYAYVVGESEDAQILRLPDRLRFSHGDLTIKLVIKDWTLPDPAD